MNPETLKDHLIICGLNRTSLSIIEELESLKEQQSPEQGDISIAADKDYIVIDLDEALLEKTSEQYEHFNYLTGDASDDEILTKAGIQQAYGIFPLLSDNKENIFITFTARRLNATIRIVARGTDIAHIGSKFSQAGVDAVVSPNFIGGMRMVSELVRPEAVQFLDQLLRQNSLYLRLEEVQIPKSSPLKDYPLSRLLALPDVDLQVLALKKRGQSYYVYNPSQNEVQEQGDLLVILGDIRHINKFKMSLKGTGSNTREEAR